MLKPIVVVLALVVALAMTSQEAGATKHCAPLPVQVSGQPTCTCTVQNYSTVTDTGVLVQVYAANGGVSSCPLTLPPRTANLCRVGVAAGTTCGCVISGEGSLTLASLSVTDTVTGNPQASVPCQ